jgi:magnesium-transporting ATPase (P-type)
VIYLFIATSLLRGQQYSDFLNLLIGLPVFALFILPPLGVYYSWKSYRRKEGSSNTRFFYFLGHAFFCMIAILLITIFVRDISQLF